MPAGVLRPKDASGTTYLDYRYSNTTGSFITAMTFDGSGREIADEYTLTVSAANPGVSCTITVTTASTKGPYDSTVFTGVVCDGATTRNDIVPGVTLTFSGSGSLANGWASKIYIGVWAGVRIAGNPTGTQLTLTSTATTPGEQSVTAGDPGLIVKYQINNTGAEAVASAVAVFHPRAKLVNKTTPRGFYYIQVTDNTPSEDAEGDGTIDPIIFTFANLDTAATPDEIDVLMNENGGGATTFDVLDIDAGTTITSTQIKRDGSTKYQIVESGALAENLVFVIDAGATNSSVENVLIFNKRHTYIAPDVAGTPGTYVQTSVTLTQSGQPSGVINAAGTVNLWAKLAISSLASNKQNPFPGDIQAEYALIGEAAWLA